MGATFLNANRKTRGDRSTSFSKRNPSLNRAYQYKANRPSDLRDRYQDSTSPNVMTSRPAQGSLYGEEIQRRLDELGLSSGPAAQAAPADSGSSMYQAAALYGPTLYEMERSIYRVFSKQRLLRGSQARRHVRLPSWLPSQKLSLTALFKKQNRSRVLIRITHIRLNSCKIRRPFLKALSRDTRGVGGLITILVTLWARSPFYFMYNINIIRLSITTILI